MVPALSLQDSTSPSGRSIRTRRPFLFASLTICCAVLLAYAGTLDAEFVFDDYELIVINPHIFKHWNPVEAFRATYWGGVQKSTLYRPIPTWSLGIEYRLWGPSEKSGPSFNTAGFHAVNLVLHSFACIALFFFLAKLVGDYKLAWIAAMLFAVHPIHTEAVSNICFGRTELYAASFLFLALWFYLLSLERRGIAPARNGAGVRQEPRSEPGVGIMVACVNPAGPPVVLAEGSTGILSAETGRIFSSGTAFMALALLSGMAAMMSKESALMLPALAWLAGAFVLQRTRGTRGIFKNSVAAARSALPFVLPVFVYVTMRLVVTGMLGETMRPLEPLTPFERLAVASKVFVDYIGLLFVPAHQNALPIYDSIPAMALPLIAQGKIAMWLLGALLAFGILIVKRAPTVAFVILWFFIALVPASNIVPIGTVKAERLLYVPSLSVALFIAAGLALIERKAGRIKRYAALVVFGLAWVFSVVLTIQRNEVWMNGFTFYYDLIVMEPKSFVGHIGMGNSHGFQEEHVKAVQELSRAVFVAPHMDGPYYNRALSYVPLGKMDEALADLRRAAELEPNRADVRRALGRLLTEMRRYDEAICEITCLLNMADAPLEEAYSARAVAHMLKGDLAWARADLLRALEKNPDSLEARYGLAEVCARLGDVEGTRLYAGYLYGRGAQVPAAASELLRKMPK